MPKSEKTAAQTQVAKHLSWVLSDTYVLMVKTHAYHWNVTGPLFPQLHSLFDGQYNELFEAADDLAERIRALDVAAPVSMHAFLQHTEVKEATEVPDATGMLMDLLVNHQNLRARIVEACDYAASHGDKGSEDLLIGRLRAHDKAIWMLQSILH